MNPTHTGFRFFAYITEKPEIGFRHSWIQALRQWHLASVSLQLSAPLCFMLALFSVTHSPSVLSSSRLRPTHVANPTERKNSLSNSSTEDPVLILLDQLLLNHVAQDGRHGRASSSHVPTLRSWVRSGKVNLNHMGRDRAGWFSRENLGVFSSRRKVGQGHGQPTGH